MQYSITLPIKREASSTLALYVDHNQMIQWEKGLKTIEWITRTPSLSGSVCHLIFGTPPSEQRMKETIVKIDWPNKAEMIYEMGPVWNRCVNHFIPNGNDTLWTMDVEFRGVEAFGIPQAAFEAKTRAGMELFQAFADQYRQTHISPSMEEVLRKIHTAFYGAALFYSLGGSVGMSIRGIDVLPNDIDLLVREVDAPAAMNLLQTLGKRMAPKAKADYKTQTFAEFVIDGVDVDLMAGLAIAAENIEFRFPCTLLTSEPTVFDSSTRLPLMPLEDWYLLYHIIPGKEQRIRQIEAWFAICPINRSRMNSLSGLTMPATVRSKLFR
jgi:hypothetical protein